MERFRRRSGLAGLALLGVLCRALIPAGFMPAAIGAGGPVAICHDGLAGEFFRELAQARRDARFVADSAAEGIDGAHGAHADHAGHAGPDALVDAANETAESPAAAQHEGWEHCPFGAAFGAALVAGDFEPALLMLAHALEPALPLQPVARQPASSYRARAPPVPAIHV